MTYTEPLILCFAVLALIGLWQARKGPRFRRWGLWIGVLGMALTSWPPVDWLLSQPLEMRYPVRPFEPLPGTQAIVVLASAVDPPHFERPYVMLGPDTYERCEYAAWIYKRHPLPILACGGKSDDNMPAFAAVMREYLEKQGIPQSMIWTEEESHNTYQNALYGAEILRRQGISRIALVVEAQGMRRAEACFRKQGIDVAPAPSRFRTWGPLSQELIPGWKAIRRNEGAFHEILGLLWYRLRGWI